MFFRKIDPKLAFFVSHEIQRQRETLDLIPSENFIIRPMREIIGSVLTNKYSEGYPGRRYYPGNVWCDEIERLAQERAKKLFRLGNGWHVNVQPYSGTPANLAVYGALLNFGDTIMGMELSSGGHLSHGHKASFSGTLYRPIHYGVDATTGRIDYDEVARLAKRHKPKMIIAGVTAYPRAIDFKKFHRIAASVKAFFMADISHVAGLVAAGLHPSPFPFADVVMTTTHKTLAGPRGAVIFCKKKYAQAIDRAVFPGIQGGPHNNIIAAKAFCFHLALQKNFISSQKQIVKNAKALAEELKRFGFQLLTGGTDTHLMVINLKNMDIDGFEAEKMLEAAGILANRNAIPGDAKPFKPSGLRLGTPALTSRGMKEKEMKIIAGFIQRILIGRESALRIKREVKKLATAFPLPGVDI